MLLVFLTAMVWRGRIREAWGGRVQKAVPQELRRQKEQALEGV
jgi:hypothetical protein